MGSRNTKEGRKRSQLSQMNSASVNHAWPSLSTIQQRLRRQPVCDDTTHWSYIYTLCELSGHMPLGVPKLSSSQVTRYIVTVQYDGQPLRQGAFFHKDSMVTRLLMVFF